MASTAYTPADYAEGYWDGTITAATVRKWIRENRQLPEGHTIERTPTGRAMIRIQDKPTSSDNVMSLVQEMEKRMAS